MLHLAKHSNQNLQPIRPLYSGWITLGCARERSLYAIQKGSHSDNGGWVLERKWKVIEMVESQGADWNQGSRRYGKNGK
jgi:hypothetical protein